MRSAQGMSGPGDLNWFRRYGRRLPPLERLPSDMPAELEAELDGLGDWAIANYDAARRATKAFWLLKVPAIVLATGGGLLGYADSKLLSLAVGALASFCILIDALYPRGQLRNAHTEAFLEILNLQRELVNRWREGRLRDSPRGESAAQLMAESRARMGHIYESIKKAAATLGAASHDTERVLRQP